MYKRQASLLARSVIVSTIALGTAFGVQASQSASDKSNSSTKSAQANDKGKKESAQRSHVPATDMIGMNVRGQQESDIGQVEDLAIDMKSGQVRYALVEFDPGFLSGERLVPVPLKELKMGLYGRALVFQNASKDKLEKMAMKKTDWNDGLVLDKDRLAKLDAAWGLPRAEGASVVRANNLLDKEVQNKAGENIGEIEELVINMDQQKVTYAMLEFERSWLTPERTVAVPLTAFSNPAGSGDELVMDVSKQKAKDMKGLTRAQMRSLDQPEVIAIVQRHIVFLEPTADSAGRTASGTKPDTRSAGAAGEGAASPSSQK